MPLYNLSSIRAPPDFLKILFAEVFLQPEQPPNRPSFFVLHLFLHVRGVVRERRSYQDKT